MHFDILADYLHALSQILRHIPNVSLYHINVLIELSILFAKRFSDLNIKNRDYIINALKSTFLSISYLEKNFQSQYFHGFCKHIIFYKIFIITI
jgi:hypothetical protein